METNKTTACIDEQADSIIVWGAARAGVIVVAPVLGALALMANEIYIILRVAKVYDVDLNESAIVVFLGSLGATFAGLALSTMIPFPPLQVPIGMGVTYAVGKTAQAWIKDGMPKDMSIYKGKFDDFKCEAKKMLEDFANHPLKDKPLGDEGKKFY